MTITPQGPAAFASSTAGTPAVSATGTNAADGVDASSDSGVGVQATTGIYAKALTSDENPHADKIAALLGIE